MLNKYAGIFVAFYALGNRLFAICINVNYTLDKGQIPLSPAPIDGSSGKRSDILHLDFTTKQVKKRTKRQQQNTTNIKKRFSYLK